MPELAGWQVFATVAAEGSFGAAARTLDISQQAVSSRIAALERQVGIVLVERRPRGSTLTVAGAAVAEWATRLLVLAEEMETGLTALRGDAQTTLRIASSHTIAECLLPNWLVSFQQQQARAQRPEISLELTVINSQGVLELVRAGQADLGLIESPDPPLGLRQRTLFHDHLIVVVPPGHPWTRLRNPLAADELARTPLVAREPGSGTRATLASAVRRALGSVDLASPVLSLSSTAAIRAAILAGAGPGVMSELAVSDDLATGRLRTVKVESLDLSRSLRAVWRSTNPLPKDARRILALAQQSWSPAS
jgi:DNA-binding transcriptional LysR family regulator